MTHVFDAGRRRRVITYVVLGIIALALAAWGLVVFDRSRANRAAQDKAERLSSEYQAAGLPTLDTDDVARLLGDDGGAVCASPANALTMGMLRTNLSNGASGPGQRPVTVDSRVVKGERLILKVYCPEKLVDFDDFIKGLNFADVSNG